MKKTITLLFLVYLSLNICAQPKDIEQWRSAAFEAKTKGDIGTSITNYKEVLKINPEDYDAKLALARLYFDKKDYSNSTKYYELIYKNDFKDVEAIFGLGKIYFKIGEYDKAIQYFKKAIDLLPTNIPPYFQLAQVYKEKNDLESAIGVYEKILKIDKTYAEAWGGMGQVYYWQEKPYSAISYLEKAKSLDPANELWTTELKKVKNSISFNFSTMFLYVNEKEESYNIDALIQRYGITKRISDAFEISLNTLFDRSDRDYSVDLPDTVRWYDNSWAKATIILPNNRMSVYGGYSKSDSKFSTYGINWATSFKVSDIKFNNSLTAAYDYYYYWNQVGKNSVTNNFTTTYKKFRLDLGLLYGEVTENVIADYFMGVYDTIPNPHHAYSVNFKYQIISNPKTHIGVHHSYYDFNYQSPRYYTPNERYLNGLMISSYYELNKFYIYFDFSYNLGQETFYKETPNGKFKGQFIDTDGEIYNFKYDEVSNKNLDNWSTNLDFGYNIKNISISAGGGRFYNPYYENITAYLAFKARF